MEVHALVDYHNLPRQMKDGGPESLARAINALVESHCPGVGEVSIRLYGGWSDEQGLSRDGTLLTQQIGSVFPLPLFDGSGQIRYLKCEIASSLLESRADLFPATLRKRHGLDVFIRNPLPPQCQTS